ncbi:MAG: DUF1573 domain-containing protein [Bacteroidota bacterium]|nr:DUF1573 domain-containing protein [Bacteroidota bacterium]
MNKYFTFLLLVFIFACKGTVSQNDASISFSKDKYNFGTIPYKKEAVYSFEFTNPGKTILIINDVKTSCGCTVPEWSKEPIRPGRKGQITIKYDAAFPSVFHKTIEVIYNGSESPFSLEIKGEVEYPEENTK